VWLGRDGLGRCVAAGEADALVDAEVVADDDEYDGERDMLPVVPAAVTTVPPEVQAARAAAAPKPSAHTNQGCTTLRPPTVTDAA
jgi:hypothetical protein